MAFKRPSPTNTFVFNDSISFNSSEMNSNSLRELNELAPSSPPFILFEINSSLFRLGCVEVVSVGEVMFENILLRMSRL